MSALEVGGTYTAYRQGTTITPQTIRVRVTWLDGDDVWYEKENDPIINQTTRDRFLEIINPKFKR